MKKNVISELLYHIKNKKIGVLSYIGIGILALMSIFFISTLILSLNDSVDIVFVIWMMLFIFLGLPAFTYYYYATKKSITNDYKEDKSIKDNILIILLYLLPLFYFSFLYILGNALN